MHERDINTDYLLIVLKKLLETRHDIKVILMSATLRASMFASYFEGFGCVSISIPGRAFPVQSFYLEDALAHTKVVIPPGSDYAFKAKSSKFFPERNLYIQKLQRLRGKVRDEVMKRLEVIDENKNSKLNKAQNQNKFIKLNQSDKDDDNL